MLFTLLNPITYKNQEYIIVYNYLGYVLLLFLITCYFIVQYQYLELDVDIYEHVLLTPEMENLYNQLERTF